MADGREQFRKEQIGNIRFKFFTNAGSLTVEAWRSTRMCGVTTFSHGLRRRTDVKLSDDLWWKLIVPVSYSGFWRWSKRYDAHMRSGLVPSWSFGVQTDSGWYLSSGDGEYPEGFMAMLRGITEFASMIEGRESEPVRMFLSPYTGEGLV